VARVVGVDGCRGGWVAVGLPGPEVVALPTLRGVLERFAGAAWVAVDMPIGLPVGPGGRASDRAARRLLGRASSRVFPAPTRACLDAPTYAAARLVETTLSAQSYALRAKILEADEAQREGPLVEAHPELAFLALTGTVLASKKTWDGQMQRRAALAQQGLELPDDLGPTGGTAAPDDVLDAAACALVAAAVEDGSAVRLGDEAEGVIWMPGPVR
jgi:predicted RNase H-like nuclease